MKNKLIVSLLILLMLLGSYCVVSYTEPSVSISAEPLVFSGSAVSPANNWQMNASVWMGRYGDKLYFIPDCKTNLYKTRYDGWLNCFENGKVTRILKLKSIKPEIVGFCNDTLYIRSNLKYYPLYSLSFPDLQLNEIFSFSGMDDRDVLFFLRNCYYATDGSVYIPVFPDSKETPHFLHVLGEEVLEFCTIPEEYRIGDDLYSLEYGYGYEAEAIVKTAPDGTRETVGLSRAHRRSIIPAYRGLLVHNERNHTNGEMLYYIDESGELITLFSVPQLSSTSAVTVNGSDVYLSFKRWEEWGEIGMRRYENDTLEGTYKISLKDYSVVKISDKIYDGLYIFDDNGIYACDENCSIYKLDFDGNVTDKLLKVR